MRHVVITEPGSPRNPDRPGSVPTATTARDPDVDCGLGFKVVARRVVTSLVALIAAGPFAGAAASANTLYIGEGANKTIHSFNAMANPLVALIPASTTGATAPRGILHLRNRNFLVVSPSPGLPVGSDIDEFAASGAFLRAFARSWARIIQALRVNTPAVIWLEERLASRPRADGSSPRSCDRGRG
jgi:hypothetical protein